MTVTTVPVSCDIGLVNAAEFTSASLVFTPSGPDYDTASNDTLPAHPISVELDAAGIGTANLWPVDLGTRNSHYAVTLVGSFVSNGANTSQAYTLGIIRPQSGTTPKLADLLAQSSGSVTVGSRIYATIADAVAAALAASNIEAIASASAAATSAATSAAFASAAAAASETNAQKWAEEQEDVPVVLGQYSAKHHALKAAASAISVAGSGSVIAGQLILAKSGKTFSGYLECDGSTYDETLYPNLASAGYFEAGIGPINVIDLGADGKLILPAFVGSDVFYYWDFDGSGAPSDVVTLDSLKSRFNGGANFNGSEPQITLNGVDIVLPELGVASPTDGGFLAKGGAYTGLAALWDAHTDASGLGGVPGWPTSSFCSSSPFSTTGAWRLSFSASTSLSGKTTGTTLGTQNSHVAVRVPNPPQVFDYILPDSVTDLGAPAGYSYYIKY